MDDPNGTEPVRALTDERGADVAIEARTFPMTPSSFDLGHVANIEVPEQSV
ncbi:MAG: hypothetical protein ACP5PB_09790 [Acidimicrobiales bacterium]